VTSALACPSRVASDTRRRQPDCDSRAARPRSECSFGSTTGTTPRSTTAARTNAAAYAGDTTARLVVPRRRLLARHEYWRGRRCCTRLSSVAACYRGSTTTTPARGRACPREQPHPLRRGQCVEVDIANRTRHRRPELRRAGGPAAAASGRGRRRSGQWPVLVRARLPDRRRCRSNGVVAQHDAVFSAAMNP
jgi:hypothetical protein